MFAIKGEHFFVYLCIGPRKSRAFVMIAIARVFCE